MNIAWYLALKNLFGNKKLFFLVVGVLILSFINISFFNSLNNGVRDITNTKLVDYTFSDLRAIPVDGNVYIEDTDYIIKKLIRIPGVAAATPRLLVSATIYDGEVYVASYLRGVDVDTELTVTKYDEIIAKGEFFSGGNDNLIILGDEITGNLDGSKGTTGFDTLDLDVGDTAIVSYASGLKKEYRVQGIVDSLFWISDFYVLIPMSEAREALGFNKEDSISSEILIKLDEGVVDKVQIKNDIVNSGINLKVVDTIEDLSLADTILESQRITVLLGNIVGVFSTFIIIFIIIYINVNNKKKHLAVFRAIGIGESDIIKSYIYLSFIYAIFGIIFGYFGLHFIAFLLKLYPIKLPVGYFYPQFKLIQLVFSAFIILISSFVAAYFASNKIIKKNIVDVLRGE